MTRDASGWSPEYATAPNAKTCIGCGRCFKICWREVMDLHGMDDAGESSALCAGEGDDFDGAFNQPTRPMPNFRFDARQC
ncbi:hypothetical protein [Mesorhizobium sp. WSM2239]|uniref:4Fe-4S ferredoxin-type domain-containing protein n=2 Tax=unclassified Mesorhizobium TaxID=325217 RepID=A0AAU8D6J0_9HYPH